MKEITYGEDSDNIGDKVEALISTDVLSARTLNRPFLNAYEEAEITNKLTSKLFGAVYGGNGVSIIPGLYEELNMDYLTPGGFFGTGNIDDKYLFYAYRFPLGGYINSDGEYIINRPNCELFERELADAFQINLNDLENNIRCTFEMSNGRVNYFLDYKIYTGNGYIEGNLGYTDEDRMHNVFDVVNSFYTAITNKMGTDIVISKTADFHLEDIFVLSSLSDMPERVYGYASKYDEGYSSGFSKNKKFICINESPTLEPDELFVISTVTQTAQVFKSDKYPTVTTLTATGDIYANSFNATSAREKKTDIVPTSYNALDEINKIDIVDFYFKTDTNKEHKKIGFIADDTDPIFSVDNKHFDIGNSIGMLLKAVQELSAENKELKEKLENL